MAARPAAACLPAEFPARNQQEHGIRLRPLREASVKIDKPPWNPRYVGGVPTRPPGAGPCPAFTYLATRDIAYRDSRSSTRMGELAEGLREALADRYAVERELGRGGMATVYLARDLRHK